MSRFLATLLGCAFTLTAIETFVSAQPAADALTVISPDGRQVLPTTQTRGREMVALDELARLLQLDVREDSRAGTLTVSVGGQVIILTPNLQLVSVAGRLVSLGAAPRRADGRWLVPLDFISRALAPILDETLELRQRSRLLLLGNVRVPQVTVSYRPRRDSGRVALEIDPYTAHTVAEDSGRLVIRFEADAIDVAQLPRARGRLVSRFETVARLPGIAIELGPAFGSFSVSSLPASNDAAQLVVDLRATGAATTDATSPAPGRLPAASSTAASADPLPDFTSRSTVQVVAIDAGHGGEEEGARGSEGTLEKDVTLRVARRLRDGIERRLGLRVVLTRTRDETVDLDERAAIANNNKADLFISLHVNASTRPAAGGAEVFYLSIDEYGEEARELAERERQPIPVIGGGTREIDLILWEMAQVRYLERSSRYAELVEQELRRRVPMSPRALQQAPFRVLVGANMPAVLVEMGFISNPDQEQQLASATFQNAVVDALISSIVRYRNYLERAPRALAGPSPSVDGNASSLREQDE